MAHRGNRKGKSTHPALRAVSLTLCLALLHALFGPEAWAQIVPLVANVPAPIGGSAAAAGAANGLGAGSSALRMPSASLTASPLGASALSAAPSFAPSLPISAIGAAAPASAVHAAPATAAAASVLAPSAAASAPQDGAAAEKTAAQTPGTAPAVAPAAEIAPSGPRTAGVRARMARPIAELKRFFAGRPEDEATASENVAAAPQDGPARSNGLSPSSAPSPKGVEAAVAEGPAPEAPRPSPQSHPRASAAAFAAGAGLVAAAALAFAAPALIPAALAAFKGYALWAGFGLLALSRFWGVPGAGIESPRGPPSLAARINDWIMKGRPAAIQSELHAKVVEEFSLKSWREAALSGLRLVLFGAPLAATALFSGVYGILNADWNFLRAGADAQGALEARVGGSSAKTWRDWFAGGLRAGASWLPVTFAGMGAGFLLAKPFAGLGSPTANGLISFDALLHGTLGAHLLGYVASALALEAVVLAVFDGTRRLAARLGAGRAAGPLAAAAALALSAGLTLSVTTMPAIVGAMLGVEASLLWLRTRADSRLAPLAVRGIFSLVIVEFTRLSLLSLAGGPAGVLANFSDLQASVWVGGLLLSALAWSAKSLRPSALWSALKLQLKRVEDFGAKWNAPSADGAPKSAWELLRLASLWSTILYFVPDVLSFGIRSVTGETAEAIPPLLVRVLTAPVDLVLIQFLFAGFAEEFMFRRGVFKPLDWLLEKAGKLKSLSPLFGGSKGFWIANAVQGLLFSAIHYVNFTALMAGSNVASADWKFGLPSFVARAVIGMMLGWLYKRSGTLMLPILAHSLLDFTQGLGLRWGVGSFVEIAAAVLFFQLFGKRQTSSPPSKSAADAKLLK